MKFTLLLPPFIILFLIALINFYWIFAHSQLYDALIFWPLINFPNVDSFDYFWHIFTNYNGHAGQYRPLGFFGYFYLLGNMFKNNQHIFNLISILFQTGISYLIKKWADHNCEIKGIGWFAALLYLFHPANIFPVYDVSCQGKYLLTAMILIYQFNYIDQNEIKQKQGILLLLLNLLALLLHEGTITFPFIVMVYSILKHKKVFYWIFPSFIPAIVFLIIRVAVKKLPTTGIMTVGLEKFWENFDQLSGIIWNPLFNYFQLGYLAFFIVFLIALFIWYKFKNIELFTYLGIQLIIIFPFLLLAKHAKYNVTLKGGYWATILVIFSFISIAKLFKNKPKLVFMLTILLFLYENFLLLRIRGNLENFLTTVGTTQNNYLARIDQKTQNHSKLIRVTGTYSQQNTPLEMDQPTTIYQSENIPGLLVKHFPTKRFILTHSGKYNKDGIELETLIQNGYYVYILNKEGAKLTVFDRFHYQSTIEADLNSELEIFEFPNT